MSSTISGTTTAELLAMPEDGIDRELIRGELREREMTRRNRRHAGTESKISHLLHSWIEAHPDCRMDVLSGEAGSILQQNPDTTVGIDVAVFSIQVLENQSDASSMVVGVPVLAVEVLSPNDRLDAVHEKIAEYLRVGVQLVWEVDPDFQTVRVHRPGTEPIMVNRTQTLSGVDVLPGFEVPVAQLFPAWK